MCSIWILVQVQVQDQTLRSVSSVRLSVTNWSSFHTCLTFHACVQFCASPFLMILTKVEGLKPDGAPWPTRPTVEVRL